jgi:hypothetical protein
MIIWKRARTIDLACERIAKALDNLVQADLRKR